MLILKKQYELEGILTKKWESAEIALYRDQQYVFGIWSYYMTGHKIFLSCLLCTSGSGSGIYFLLFSVRQNDCSLFDRRQNRCNNRAKFQAAIPYGKYKFTKQWQISQYIMHRAFSTIVLGIKTFTSRTKVRIFLMLLYSFNTCDISNIGNGDHLIICNIYLDSLDTNCWTPYCLGTFESFLRL